MLKYILVIYALILATQKEMMMEGNSEEQQRFLEKFTKEITDIIVKYDSPEEMAIVVHVFLDLALGHTTFLTMKMSDKLGVDSHYFDIAAETTKRSLDNVIAQRRQ